MRENMLGDAFLKSTALFDSFCHKDIIIKQAR